MTDCSQFHPVLTVLAEYGNAPFLWRVDRPEQGGVGPNWVDGSFWDESFPMSEALWRKFADWAIEFDRTRFYSEDFDSNDWDWIAFHARGLQLSRWLKAEVGDAYRIVYVKNHDDPNHRVDTRTEILKDGALDPLPVLRSSRPDPTRFCNRIISGGQTGADRAALDFAIGFAFDQGYVHGGWAPNGRLAEDGTIPLKYQLEELSGGGYRQRTRRNVEAADGTLILNMGQLDGGTLATQRFAQQVAKPVLVVPLDGDVTRELIDGTLTWLRQHRITVLNVAGPRETKRPGIYGRSLAFLKSLHQAAALEASKPCESLPQHEPAFCEPHSQTSYASIPPSGDPIS